MFISELTPYHFRNLSSEKVTFSPQVNIVVGKNGQGKTNLIECIQWDQSEASVFGKVVLSYGETALGVSIEKGGRTFYVNGEKSKSITDYLGRLLCITFSPSSLEILQGQPSGRRKFVDKYLADLYPRILNNLIAYQRALANKNKILKEERSPKELLSPWNEILAKEAAIIVAARDEFVRELEVKAREVLKEFSPKDEVLSLSMKKSSAATSAEEIYEAMKRGEDREISYRSALIGPHRDDLLVSLGEHEARSFASQGQTRSVVLSLLLGVLHLLEEKRGESPVVLLDDVNSELDQGRSSAFFSLVKSSTRQIFVTGTDASVGHLSEKEGYFVLNVKDGSMNSVNS